MTPRQQEVLASVVAVILGAVTFFILKHVFGVA